MPGDGAALVQRIGSAGGASPGGSTGCVAQRRGAFGSCAGGVVDVDGAGREDSPVPIYRRSLVALVVTTAVALGACGSDSDTASDATSEKATSERAADKAADTTSGAGVDSSAGKEKTSATSAKGDAAATIDPAFRSETYSVAEHWLCNPAGDLGSCDVDRDLTVIAPDGSTTVEKFVAAADPNIDCFYVYPTISSDTTPNADLNPDNSETMTVASQFSRFGSVCRLFAPVYRQVPLAALAGAFGGPSPESSRPQPDRELPYNDVRDAWRHYLATENEVDGERRGVVLVGHSQGAGVLSRLIREEIDPNEDQRALLVSALLIGAAVRVPAGADVGGDFANVPACRSVGQTGCVVSYASFRSTAPPTEGAFFGRPREGDGEALCTNPAALGGGSAELDMALADRSRTLVDPVAAAAITTRFISMPGLLSGECVSKGGYNYLEVTVHGDPSDARVDDIGGDLTPPWGLHLVDMQIEMDNLVALVRAQATAWRT